MHSKIRQKEQLMELVPIGTEIEIVAKDPLSVGPSTSATEERRKDSLIREIYRVKEIYSNGVLVVSEKGNRKTLSIGDLIIMNIIKQKLPDEL